jgi:hypothetical protein
LIAQGQHQIGRRPGIPARDAEGHLHPGVLEIAVGRDTLDADINAAAGGMGLQDEAGFLAISDGLGNDEVDAGDA